MAEGTASKRVLMLLSNGFAPDPRVYKEARTLSQAGFDVRVLCMSRNPGAQPRQERMDGVRVERFEVGRVRSGKLLDVYLRLRRFYRQVKRHLRDAGESFGLVHAHDLDTLELGLSLKRSARVPLIYDAHELFLGYTPNRALNLALYGLETSMVRAPDAFIHAASERADLFKRWHPSTRRKPHVVLDNYPPRVPDFKKVEAGTAGRIVFQYQGMLKPPRCVLEVVRAVSTLTLPERAKLELHLYGAIEGEYAERIRGFIATHGLQQTVQLKGYLPYPQLLEATRRTDVGIVSLRPTHPNNIHAAPNKLYDYIACKNIVLAQSLPGLSRIVENDALGFVCDFRDVDSIVRAMRQVLALSDLRERQDTAFVAHAQRYNWEAQQDELVELYSRLLS